MLVLELLWLLVAAVVGFLVGASFTAFAHFTSLMGCGFGCIAYQLAGSMRRRKVLSELALISQSKRPRSANRNAAIGPRLNREADAIGKAQLVAGFVLLPLSVHLVLHVAENERIQEWLDMPMAAMPPGVMQDLTIVAAVTSAAWLLYRLFTWRPHAL